MQASYTHQVLRVVVAKICQTVGWQGVTGTALEIMVDILDRYIREICRTTHDYTEHYNRTEGNLDDLELTLRDMGINMNEIIEYISYVDPIITNLEIPKYPIAKESHFNFLKPGSKEVLTRPVHIHEHLPPINPQEEEAAYSNGEKDIDVVGLPSEDVFKRPAESDANPTKKIKLEEEGRATREITSVMMTTSGFISPAREGKLPESKPPKLVEEFPKPIPPPMISPSTFKSKDSPFSVPSSGPIDKKLEKKLKKKNHDKEKKKDKHLKDKYSTMSDPNDTAPYDPIPPPQNLPPPIIMPREANEQMIMAERKKELKKLKMKNKEETKKKKEKPPKHPKMQSFDQGFMDSKSTFDPYQVLPTSINPPIAASSQIQAHKYLTGAAHALFPNPMDFGSQQTPLMSTQNPLIEGKLVSEPDKQKLNIFKKISKPKDDPVKHQQSMQSQMDFLTPSKLDRFDSNQPSTSHPPQTFSDPIKKMHKLPKETTLTRVDDSLNMPMNLSGPSRSNDSSFEEIPVPKTPTIPPKTPDFKMSQSVEKKEKKERKKKEKKVNLDQTDWMGGSSQQQQQQQQHFPNPFDLSSPNNSFLQNLQTSSLMGNLANSFMLNRNPFSMAATDLFSSGPGLIPKAPFSMQQSPLNAMLNPYGMDMNLFQQQASPPIKPKKVKPPKPAKPTMEILQTMGSKFCNVAPLVPPSILKERHFDPPLMNVDTFPLQQQSMNTAFDQLLKDQHHQQQLQTSTPAKKFIDEKLETFDLTKDSSPEPAMTAPMPSTSSTHIITESVPTAVTSSFQQESILPTIPEHSDLPQPIVKEKSKEKKKKKDKDRDKERDKDKEERKKKKKEKKKKKDKHKDKEKHRASMSTLDSQSNDTEDTADNNSTSSVPKLMLKLNSPRPNTPDTHKKTSMQRSRNEDFEFPSPHQETSHRGSSPHLSGYARDPSPELARISPLVTRPPKIKHTKKKDDEKIGKTSSNDESSSVVKEGKIKQTPESSKVDLTATPKASQKTESFKRKNETEKIVDADGSTVWICPACGSIDDGSPMIGCDACDAWYHWACVGIKVEPNENEDWFCRACISRKQSDQLEGKKKKRKKKDRESKNL
ncbi:transcription initiation factor TFIID subunit 3 isoform X3 [Chironomus tepperi]|uniref:transcription initiation factor TFIID subunit 3 isoform X3 n=1 Tax=Chironomus tepperi TaxID=113505 RepID=UPI00391F8E71